MKKIRRIVYNLLMSNTAGKYVVRHGLNIFFPGSQNYWEKRYRNNGNSGEGSFGESAGYKADFLNRFVNENKIRKVIELGCGDGNQLQQFQFPEYIGFDVSPTAIAICKELFKGDTSKKFMLYDERAIRENRMDSQADVVLSLDVVYHLVEDEVYERYMHHLFGCDTKYVIIYAWDVEYEKQYHMRHRNFSKWINNNVTGFQLKERVSNPKYCDFFVYEKVTL